MVVLIVEHRSVAHGVTRSSADVASLIRISSEGSARFSPTNRSALNSPSHRDQY
jgi:hypothetical protein